MEHFGEPAAVLAASRKELFKVPGMNKRLADALRNAPHPSVHEEEVGRLREQKIRTWLLGDPDYPSRLELCPDAPVLLYGKGSFDLERERTISIVGTRNISPYGKTVCKKLVEGLAGSGVTVVSGLAYGVDIRAHRVALDQGMTTIAVAGHGPDRTYPFEHAPDLREMLPNGGMITEFPLGAKPDKHHFPRRNRIIAGISDCTVLVETDRKGGAMITADIAHSYEREVMCFPGRAGDATSRGCNKLIKEHKAALIEGVEDLVHLMHWEGDGEQKGAVVPHQKDLFSMDLSEEERFVARIVEREGRASMDGIAQKADMPIGKLSPLLLDLELKGVLDSLPGKIYVRSDNG
jgi:DNA processing protein